MRAVPLQPATTSTMQIGVRLWSQYAQSLLLDGLHYNGVSILSGRNLSGFLVQRVIDVLTTPGQRRLHPSRVQMHRRLSGIFATLALAQLSFGGIVARYSAHEVSSCSASAQQKLVHGPMHGQLTDVRVMRDIAGLGGTPACDHSAQGTCAGMLSCTPAIASDGSTHSAAVIRPAQVQQRILGLIPGPSPTPEPPPPRL